MLDPQFYLPYADHHRLREHDYWPKPYQSADFWGGSELTELIKSLLELNSQLGCVDFILPGLYASNVNDDWLARQKALIEEAESINSNNLNLVATVALSEQVTRDQNQIHEILEAADNWSVNTVYLVCEHPRGEYLVSDPNWLANVLDLTAGLRLKNKKVIIGYCSQQMLIASCASATGVASGTWMNVRSFPPDKFRMQYEDEIKQRTIWYYCPQTLSEYKIPFLDIASRLGVLQDVAPKKEFGSNYADILFQGPQPSSVGFTEQAAFRHYLQCLRGQVTNARRTTFNDTVDAHEKALDTAETLLESLHNIGVRGQHRDFKEVVDTNRAALSVLRATRGPILRRYWDRL
ncbi:hypothetical protein NDA01_29765 [Trichocoleus desertorum AS-A10]|uniref:hypothetical protein n=1 Tax=Trichocoleus desertorum TaxID=1481672 RepID=UPI0032977AD7